MTENLKLKEDICSALRNVIGPETGADVVQMRLILNLEIHENGRVDYTFRPSSPLCPIALILVTELLIL